MRHAAPFPRRLAPVGEGGAVLRMAHRAAIQDRLAQAGGEFAEPGPGLDGAAFFGREAVDVHDARWTLAERAMGL